MKSQSALIRQISRQRDVSASLQIRWIPAIIEDHPQCNMAVVNIPPMLPVTGINLNRASEIN